MKKIILLLAMFLTISAFSQIKKGTTSGMAGSGTIGYIPQFSAAKTLTNSIISQTTNTILINGSGTFSTSIGVGVVPYASGIRIKDAESLFFGDATNSLRNSGSALFVNGAGYLALQTGGDYGILIYGDGSCKLGRTQTFTVKANSSLSMGSCPSYTTVSLVQYDVYDSLGYLKIKH